MSQMIDLRENFFGQLKIERFSVKFQIKFKLIFDFLTKEVLPNRLLNTPVFFFDGRRMSISRVFNSTLLLKKICLLRNTGEFLKNNGARHPQRDQPMLIALQKLLEYLEESLTFFEATFVQKQEERLEILNKQLFFFTNCVP